MLCISFTGIGFGYFLSSVFSKPEDAVGIAPVVLMPIMLFGGLFANADGYPTWIGWLQYVSPARHALEALVRNEFETREIGPFEPNPIDFLQFNIGKPICLVMIAVFAIFLRVLAYYSLKFFMTKFQ